MTGSSWRSTPSIPRDSTDTKYKSMKTLVIILVLWLSASALFVALWHKFITNNRNDFDP